MARGSEAKAKIAKKIIECFGQEHVIESGGKLYINTTENGEKIQICLAMTCPKTMVGEDAPVAAPSTGNAFDNFLTSNTEPFKPAEITQEERDTVRDLMTKLGL